MRKRIYLGVVAFGALLFVGASCYLAGRSSESAGTEQAGEGNHGSYLSGRAPQPTASPLNASDQQETPAPNVTSRFGRLAKQLRESSDYRTFAHSARLRPEEGGYFYAMHAANLCSMSIMAMPNTVRDSISGVIASTGTIDSYRVSAIERFAGRCASFAPEEAADLLREVKRSAASGGDPLVDQRAILSASLTQKDVVAAKEALGRLISFGDLLALQKGDLLSRTMASNAASTNKGEFWFDGRFYEPAYASSIIRTAVLLAACDDNTWCELDEQMLLSCFGGQLCTNDRQEYFKKRIMMVDEAGIDLLAPVIEMSSKIRTALKENRVSAFLR